MTSRRAICGAFDFLQRRVVFYLFFLGIFEQCSERYILMPICNFTSLRSVAYSCRFARGHFFIIFGSSFFNIVLEANEYETGSIAIISTTTKNKLNWINRAVNTSMFNLYNTMHSNNVIQALCDR